MSAFAIGSEFVEEASGSRHRVVAPPDPFGVAALLDTVATAPDAATRRRVRKLRTALHRERHDVAARLCRLARAVERTADCGQAAKAIRRLALDTWPDTLRIVAVDDAEPGEAPANIGNREPLG